MASAWRIVRASREKTAFTGEGPRRYGGRWNSAGVRVIYVSEHQSTAAFEVFANRVPFILDERYKAFHLEWPDHLTEIFPVKNLPTNWRVHPPPIATQEIGNAWVKEQRSVVLALPSVISPADTNFLLNPEHRDFKRIRIAPSVDYEFDPRLLKR
ncbi:MAG TPA: RES family NAD+ phosphorylase [Candidatus Udaeobacter sp.]|jgi:RES domain-containing protein|nr:RES family NAD+ phosphorylase [Candidatus Udaeobacter sp.]